MSLFDASGRFVRSVPLPHFDGAPVRTAHPVAGGFVGTAALAAGRPSGAAAGPMPLLLARGDSVHAVLALLPARNEMMQLQLGPAAVITRGHPFAEHTLWDLTPGGDGVVLVERARARGSREGSFHLTRVDLQGDTVFHRTYRYTPRPVPEGVVEELTEGVLSGVRRVGREVYPAGRAARILGEALEPSAALPPVTDLVVGRDGSLWLRREETGGPYVRWHVLDADARPLGRLDLPAHLEVLSADRETLLGTMPGEYDVPLLVRYRVRAAPEG